MKNRRQAFFSFLFQLFFLAGTVLPAFPSADADTTRSCLWEVRSQTNTVYLLGSVHMLKKENYPLKPVILSAFEKSGIILFEVHLDSAESPAVQAGMMARALETEGKTLRDRLGVEVYERLLRETQTMGLNIEQFESFKSWFVTLMLMAQKVHQLGFDPAYGIDRVLFRRAKASDKDIRGLETVACQVDLFDHLAEEFKDAFVLQALEELDLLETAIDDLIAAWSEGDVASLETLVSGSFQGYHELYEAFVAERNRNWLPKIMKLVENRIPAMVIVGAGHLLGEKGLVMLLREKGYSVKQL